MYAIDWPYEGGGHRAEEDPSGWQAVLALAYERRAARTVLAARHHQGPLQVQKPFYPEGPQTCHGIVLHPPGGIAGGDRLEIDVRVSREASALLTTPGAGKWYRSARPAQTALQRIRMRVESGGALEWLPQPSILFEGAQCAMHTEVQVEGDGCYLGWEILCLGRTASGECFGKGRLLMSCRLHSDGEPLWLERGCIEGGSRLLASPAGLDGQPVTATFVAVASAEALSPKLLTACRTLSPSTGRGAISRLPRLLVARYLGDCTEAAHDYFVRLWGLIRPALLGREAAPPRIWRT